VDGEAKHAGQIIFCLKDVLKIFRVFKTLPPYYISMSIIARAREGARNKNIFPTGLQGGCQSFAA
jgi:hypothetical protein